MRVGACWNGNLRIRVCIAHDTGSRRDSRRDSRFDIHTQARNAGHEEAYARVRARKSEWKRAIQGNMRKEAGARARRNEEKGLRRGGGGGSSTGTERRDKERTDETTGAGEKEITAGSDRVVEINVARLIGATEECACGPSGSQPANARCVARMFLQSAAVPCQRTARVFRCLIVHVPLQDDIIAHDYSAEKKGPTVAGRVNDS